MNKLMLKSANDVTSQLFDNIPCLIAVRDKELVEPNVVFRRSGK